MKASSIPLDSDALRANLATTAQAVVIPDRYRPLFTAVDGFYGIRTSLGETMAEYFHTYRNADLLIEGFQTILLRNWTYFERSDERAQLFDLLAELVLELLESPLSDEQFSLLLRSLSMWCTAALGGASGDAYDESLLRVATTLSRLLPTQTTAFLERDALLRNLVEQAVRRPALAPAFHGLYRQLLLHRPPARRRAPGRARMGALRRG